MLVMFRSAVLALTRWRYLSGGKNRELYMILFTVSGSRCLFLFTQRTARLVQDGALTRDIL